MKEQLIDFETAKLAKEKGYPQRKKAIIGKYREDGTIQKGGPGAAVCDKNIEWFEAPSQSLLQKWLRENHNIQVLSIPFGKDPTIKNSETTYVYIANPRQFYGFIDRTGCSKKCYKTYEQALEKGLIEALKLINL